MQGIFAQSPVTLSISTLMDFVNKDKESNRDTFPIGPNGALAWIKNDTISLTLEGVFE